jgi:hypothetical protein
MFMAPRACGPVPGEIDGQRIARHAHGDGDRHRVAAHAVVVQVVGERIFPARQLGDALAYAPSRVFDDVLDRLPHRLDAHLPRQFARRRRAALVGGDLHLQVERALFRVARVAGDEIQHPVVQLSARTMRTTGMRMPSSKMLREPPAIEPGTEPPTSA